MGSVAYAGKKLDGVEPAKACRDVPNHSPISARLTKNLACQPQEREDIGVTEATSDAHRLEGDGVIKPLDGLGRIAPIPQAHRFGTLVARRTGWSVPCAPNAQRPKISVEALNWGP